MLLVGIAGTEGLPNQMPITFTHRKILIFIIILISAVQIRAFLCGPDSINYYSVAKSLSFDRDLMLNNEFEARGHGMTITPTYHIVEQHQIGAALIWMFISDFLKSIGLGGERNLGIAINLSEYLLGILALIFIFRICLKFFDRRAAILSILAVLFGTNLFVYITILSGSSHISGIFFISCFLLFYFSTYKERPKTDWLILGGLAGLMLMARGDAALYLIFPAYDLFRCAKNKDLKTALFYSFFFILGLLFTFSPQISFWKIIFGKLFRPVGEADYFTGNKFLEVLFSAHRGFLFSAPLLGLCFFSGLFYFYRKEKILAVSSVIIFLSLVYGIGRAKFFWDSGSYGARYFLMFIPLFILAVGACFKHLSLKNQVVIIIISSAWSFFLFMLYVRSESYSYKSIIYALSPDFFCEGLRETWGFFKNVTLKFVFLKAVFLTAIFLAVLSLWQLFKRIKIPKAFLKRISLYLAGGIIVYIHIIFMECWLNDQKVISRLQKEEFYQNAVFGEFDKFDLAQMYLMHAAELRRAGQTAMVIETVKRAARLYPPYEQDCLEYLYEIYQEK